jgi:mRNA interferase HigB
VRIISVTRLRRFWQASPGQRNAERPLREWWVEVSEAAWRHPADVKLTFGKRVDFFTSRNGSDLAVFDILSGHYRLIAAIHYLPHHFEKGRVYVLRIMTHREYDKDQWKREL